MKKTKNYFFVLFFVFLSCCNGEESKDKKCQCVKEGVQVSIPEMPKEQMQGLCSNFGGQLQNCP